MVKEEEIMAEAGGGGGGRAYMDMLGVGEEAMADYFLCLSPPPSYLSSAAVSTTTSASYLPPPAAPYQHILSFSGRPEEQYHGRDIFGAFQFYGAGGGHPVPVAVPQKSSPTTECSSSISSMSSSPTATAVSTPKPQAPKRKGSRGSDQRKAAPAAAVANKRPRVRRERLGERILALQQLVSPFGKTDTASVLHEALGYIRFLHDQVQVLSSPYMQRLPPSAPRAPEPRPPPSDLRSRGLCLVPVACTDHVAGGGNGADVWSSVAAMGLAAADGADDKEAAVTLRGDRHTGQLA